MKVRLLKAWKGWGPDHVFSDMPANVAGELIRRGIGDEVADLRDAVAPPRRRGAGMRAGEDYVTR
jgi:hypothetical protein